MASPYEGENPYPPTDARYYDWMAEKALYDAAKEDAKKGKPKPVTPTTKADKIIHQARKDAAKEAGGVSAGMIAALVVAGGALLYLLMKGR